MKHKKKSLTPQQIVEAEIESRGQGNDWKTAYVMMHELIQKPEWRMFRAEDTLFLIHNHKNKEQSVEFFIYNADTPEDLKHNLKDFFKALKVAGFKIAMFTPVGQHTFNLIHEANHNAKQVGRQVRVELQHA